MTLFFCQPISIIAFKDTMQNGSTLSPMCDKKSTISINHTKSGSVQCACRPEEGKSLTNARQLTSPITSRFMSILSRGNNYCMTLLVIIQHKGVLHGTIVAANVPCYWLSNMTTHIIPAKWPWPLDGHLALNYLLNLGRPFISKILMERLVNVTLQHFSSILPSTSVPFCKLQ